LFLETFGAVFVGLETLVGGLAAELEFLILNRQNFVPALPHFNVLAQLCVFRLQVVDYNLNPGLSRFDNFQLA
jgi:hypothetical protein